MTDGGYWPKGKMRVITLIVIGGFLSLAAGCDVVTSKYETLDEARDDTLFRRGWLPDILPESTVSIRTSNDLDTNTSEGEFMVAVEDVDTLVRRLSALEEPYVDHADYIVKMQKSGYKGFSYTAGLTWLFLCNRDTGHCIYRLPYSGLSSRRL
ncbi:MAG: hypothetical protein NXH95_18020 [Pseudomonadaceae bacterium]|nr:hypothetical protein [Pseudomonadaceae bacterium]